MFSHHYIGQCPNCSVHPRAWRMGRCCGRGMGYWIYGMCTGCPTESIYFPTIHYILTCEIIYEQSPMILHPWFIIIPNWQRFLMRCHSCCHKYASRWNFPSSSVSFNWLPSFIDFPFFTRHGEIYFHGDHWTDHISSTVSHSDIWWMTTFLVTTIPVM